MSIAKNYLNAEAIDALNRIVTAYLEFAELQARSRKPMHMGDWIAKLDAFLKLSDREILTHSGKISHETAKDKAEAEYETFRVAQAALPQPVDRDFEKTVEELKKLESEAKAKQKPACKKKGGRQMTTVPQQCAMPEPHAPFADSAKREKAIKANL